MVLEMRAIMVLYMSLNYGIRNEGNYGIGNEGKLWY